MATILFGTFIIPTIYSFQKPHNVFIITITITITTTTTTTTIIIIMKTFFKEGLKFIFTYQQDMFQMKHHYY